MKKIKKRFLEKDAHIVDTLTLNFDGCVLCNFSSKWTNAVEDQVKTTKAAISSL